MPANHPQKRWRASDPHAVRTVHPSVIPIDVLAWRGAAAKGSQQETEPSFGRDHNHRSYKSYWSYEPDPDAPTRQPPAASRLRIRLANGYERERGSPSSRNIRMICRARISLISRCLGIGCDTPVLGFRYQSCLAPCRIRVQPIPSIILTKSTRFMRQANPRRAGLQVSHPQSSPCTGL